MGQFAYSYTNTTNYYRFVLLSPVLPLKKYPAIFSFLFLPYKFFNDFFKFYENIVRILIGIVLNL